MRIAAPGVSLDMRDTSDRWNSLNAARACVAFALAAFFFVPRVSWGEIRYSIQDLGTFGGTDSIASTITDNGIITGDAHYGPGGYHAFRTTVGNPINPATGDVGTLGGTHSSGLGVNASGRVVGWSWYADNSSQRAFRTAPFSSIDPATDDLGTLGGAQSNANGINVSGQVVGWANVPGSSTPFDTHHAFRTAANSQINPSTDDLGTLGGRSSTGIAINDIGQVVGWSHVPGDGAQHAFGTSANAAINPLTDDLGTLGGRDSIAHGISSTGQVVGDSLLFGDLIRHAYRTAPNIAINPATDDLGTLGGSQSGGYGINDAGDVVGWAYPSGDPAQHAFLHDGTSMVDLNTLIDPSSGWLLSVARDIDNHDRIVGVGFIGGYPHAFVLTPVPEPGTLVVIGTAALLIRARRSRFMTNTALPHDHLPATIMPG